jgi:hypothetical protein
MAAWRRQRCATQIYHALVQAGYTVEDLRELAQLRATVDLEPVAPVAAADPAQPTLSEILAVWQPA